MTVLQWRAGQLPGQTELEGGEPYVVDSPSMEGRTIARPDHRPPGGVEARTKPSMEGRTIARPDVTATSAPLRTARPAFNGGPDNCPARPSATSTTTSRACAFNGGPDNCPARLGDEEQVLVERLGPSMEGRTIARPDMLITDGSLGSIAPLQWRAGQLPGQTPTAMRPTPAGTVSFNGGPDNCPARRKQQRQSTGC